MAGNLGEGRGSNAHNMPCECSFCDKAVQPNDAGFLCPSCSQGFESPQQCRRFPVALGPLASCFSFGKRTIYDPEAFHPGRPLLSQFWLFFFLETLSLTPIPQQSYLFWFSFLTKGFSPVVDFPLCFSQFSLCPFLDHSLSRFCLAGLCSPGTSL